LVEALYTLAGVSGGSRPILQGDRLDGRAREKGGGRREGERRRETGR
jgi:hypothetical protein